MLKVSSLVTAAASPEIPQARFRPWMAIALLPFLAECREKCRAQRRDLRLIAETKDSIPGGRIYQNEVINRIMCDRFRWEGPVGGAQGDILLERPSRRRPSPVDDDRVGDGENNSQIRSSS